MKPDTCHYTPLRFWTKPVSNARFISRGAAGLKAPAHSKPAGRAGTPAPIYV